VLGLLRWFLERNNAHGAGVLACTPANITGGLEVSVTLKAQALELTGARAVEGGGAEVGQPDGAKKKFHRD
jgi:hypothetical protein